MKKTVEITIEIDRAKIMLGVAGFPDTYKMTEEEVFSTVLSLVECYGASFDIKNKDETD